MRYEPTAITRELGRKIKNLGRISKKKLGERNRGSLTSTHRRQLHTQTRSVLK